MNEDENKFEIHKNKRSKLPFAVFVFSNNKNDVITDYKQVFTDIISDRIQEKYNK